MIIAYEAVNALGGSGIERYTRSLGKELALRRSGDTIRVIASRRRTAQYIEAFGSQDNLRINEVCWKPGTLGKGLIPLVEFFNGRSIRSAMASSDLTHLTGDIRPVKATGRFVQTIHDLFPLDHDFANHRTFRDQFKKVIEYRIERAAAILTPSAYTANAIREQYPKATTPITVTPLASDSLFRPVPLSQENRASLGIGDRPYLIHIGRVDARKNVERILEAYTHLPKHITSEVSILLVGVAGDAEVYQKLYPREVETGQVVIIPRVTQEQLVQLISSAMLMPFVSLAEGFGLPVVEAMQCGCPVITSTTTSLPEVAGEAAILVDPYDVDAISHAMQKLLDDEPLRDELRNRGLEQVKQFSWQETARRTSLVYDQVVGG